MSNEQEKSPETAAADAAPASAPANPAANSGSHAPRANRDGGRDRGGRDNNHRGDRGDRGGRDRRPSLPARNADGSAPAPDAEGGAPADGAAAAAGHEHRGDRRGRSGGGGDRGRGRGGDRGRGRGRRDGPQADLSANEYSDKVVHVNRCAKVVKGGRRFSFAALVVSGDGKGRVGLGYGKAKEVPDAIRKGTDRAHRELKQVNLRANTIPHEVFGEFDGGKVLLRPASPGTGVIAGGGVRAVLEVVGIKDVLTKSLGSKNPLAVVKATINGLLKLRTLEQIRHVRSLSSAAAEEPAALKDEDAVATEDAAPAVA